MKKLILSILAFSLATTALPQQVKEIEILPNEKWWGGATDLGNKMPFCDNTTEADLQTQNFNNQTTPLSRIRGVISGVTVHSGFN